MNSLGESFYVGTGSTPITTQQLSDLGEYFGHKHKVTRKFTELYVSDTLSCTKKLSTSVPILGHGGTQMRLTIINRKLGVTNV